MPAATLGEGEAVAPAEEVANFVAADGPGSAEDVEADAEPDKGTKAVAPTEPAAAPSHTAASDPWQALAQIGAQLVAALAAASDSDATAHPWVERDTATGARSLKIPLPPPETAAHLANALSALAGSLRGKLG
ncbi:hypothetical protein [Rhizobium leguminosarum]|uniref:hypothetical protein n=1 Tax=Rhizobium leguminosarum TaxID=384 RepID=UPI001AECDC53|nr:hypothetical protein [Rhizobium leguminosarum]